MNDIKDDKNIQINKKDEKNKEDIFRTPNLVYPDLNTKDDIKEFFENNVKIESINENYTVNGYRNFIKQQLQDFIGTYNNHSYDHVILLLGAGASVVSDSTGKPDIKFGNTMQQIASKILKEISTASDNHTFLHCDEIKRFLSQKNTISEDDKNEKNLSNILPSPFPLEDFISSLNTFIAGNINLINKNSEKKSLDLLKRANRTRNYIIQTLFEKVNYVFTENMPFKHTAVILRLNQMLKSSAEKMMVVTTNYDLAIEKMLKKNGFTIFDGFTYSDNIFNDDEFDWVLSKEVESLNTKELIYKSNMIDLLKIHGSINWKRDIEGTKKVDISEINQILSDKGNNEDKSENQESLNNVFEENEKLNKIGMIFPSSNKYMQSYEEPYFDLITRFQEKLHKSNTLLVTSGFSFGDNHISRMILNAIKHNPGLKCLITNYEINNDTSTIGLDNIDEEKYGNSNWRQLDKLRIDGYSIAFLKAAMNDEQYGLLFYLR